MAVWAQGLTPVIPVFWDAKAGGLRGQEFETSLTNMAGLELWASSNPLALTFTKCWDTGMSHQSYSPFLLLLWTTLQLDLACGPDRPAPVYAVLASGPALLHRYFNPRCDSLARHLPSIQPQPHWFLFTTSLSRPTVYLDYTLLNSLLQYGRPGRLLEPKSSRQAWATQQDPISTKNKNVARHSGTCLLVPAIWEAEVGGSRKPRR
ncbi:hypothetical protein AAY473_016304 [Plecturocebus cupreus]